MYEFDKVEAHNLPSQFYSLEDVGFSKSQSLFTHIKKFTGTELLLAGKYKQQRLFGIVIICVDTMKERKRIAKVLKKDFPKVLIDIRVGGSTIEIYTRFNFKEYEKTLEDTIATEPCSARYICFNSMFVGAFIANQVKRILKEESIKKNIIFDIDTLRFCA